MLRYILVAAILPILIVGSVLAQEGDGGYAGAFLQVPIGARPTAMGGAYTAVSDDAAGVMFNVAGLSNLRRPLFGTSYRAMKLDRTLGYATFILPVEQQAVIGFHWLYGGSGKVAARDSDGYELGHDISQNNHDFSAIFTKRFERYLSLGTKINYYHSTMPEIKASSIGFDFGAMLHLDMFVDREKRAVMPIQEMQVGLTVKYINVKYPWNSQEYNIVYEGDDRGFVQDDKVPFQVALGGSARFLEKKLLVATDLVKNEHQAMEFRGGAEYQIAPQFALRGGYGDSRLTAGTGYLFQLGKQRFALDYAFSTDKADEGSEHIFSFDLLF